MPESTGNATAPHEKEHPKGQIDGRKQDSVRQTKLAVGSAESVESLTGL